MPAEEKTEKDYLFSDMKLNADRERLNLQEQTWDPFTIRHLESLNITPGWECLNVGAGYGSITAWIAGQVGPTGRVVATDIRPELHRDVSGQVEIRKHDIIKDEIEKNHYDLVFARMLLQHLKEPDKALSNMVDAVKPGGWLLIEEIDNFMIPRLDSKNPQADYFYRAGAKYFDAFQRIGFDLEFGRKVRSLLDQFGFVEVHGEGNYPLSRGGEPWARALSDAIRLMFDALINSKSVEEVEARKVRDEYLKLLDDPSFYFVCAPLCSAWGRKPLK